MIFENPYKIGFVLVDPLIANKKQSKNLKETEKIKKLLNREGLQFSAARAKADIDRLYNETERAAFEDFRGKSFFESEHIEIILNWVIVMCLSPKFLATDFLFSTLAWTKLMQTDRYAKDMAYSALVVTTATEKTKEWVL